MRFDDFSLTGAALALISISIACGASEETAPGSPAGGAGGASGVGGVSGGAGDPAGGAGNSAGGAGNSAGGTGSATGGTAGSTAGSGGAAGNAGTAIDCRSDGDGMTTLVFVNRCSSQLTFRGSDIEGGTLAPGMFACVDIGTAIEPLSSKRYWGFVGADPGSGHHTLAEFTFNTDFNDFDWYNISHVDAHNLPLEITPVARSNCEVLSCAADLLADCPEVGRFPSAADPVACVSPDRDDPNSAVALYFESCDEAYAWSGDDQNGDDPSPMRACAGEDWDITFCPAEDGS